jgi:hypothetical protein
MTGRLASRIATHGRWRGWWTRRATEAISITASKQTATSGRAAAPGPNLPSSGARIKKSPSPSRADIRTQPHRSCFRPTAAVARTTVRAAPFAWNARRHARRRDCLIGGSSRPGGPGNKRKYDRFRTARSHKDLPPQMPARTQIRISTRASRSTRSSPQVRISRWHGVRFSRPIDAAPRSSSLARLIEAASTWARSWGRCSVTDLAEERSPARRDP